MRGIRLEGAQIVDALAHADIANRRAELLGQGEDDTTLGRAVELGQHQPGKLHRLVELFGLVDGVLAGAGIEHQQHFMRRGLVQLAHDPADLLQLLHQVVFGVQAAGGVGDQHVNTTRFGSLHRIEDHRSRVGAGVLGDYRNVVALPPDLQLLHGSRAEGVASSKHDFLAFELQLLRQLANSGGFADAIDAHHQNHEWLFAAVDLQRLLDRLE